MTAVVYRLHPLTLVLGPVRILRGWLIPLVIAMALGRNRSGDGVLSGLGFIVVLIGAGLLRQFIELIRMRWWIEGDSFQIRSGVLQVETRSIPLDRIHNVDIDQALFPRLLGLAEVRLETAGAQGSDVTLRYVSLDHAHWLHDMLMAREQHREGRVEAEPPALVETSLRELLLAGATANRIGALVAGIGVLAGWALDLGFDPVEVAGEAESYLDFGFRNPWLTVVVVLGIPILLVGWAVSIVETILRYYGFRLVDHGREVRREHGLLSRSAGTVPLQRVQAVRVDRPLLRRFVGYGTVVADTAGSVAAGSESGTGVVAPIATDASIPALVARMIGAPSWDEIGLQPVSRLAIRRSAVRVLMVAVPVSVGLAFLDVRLAVAAAVLGLVWALLWSRWRYAALGYRIDSGLAVARSGVLTRHTWVVPTGKVQSVAVYRSPFQRRLDLATLSIDTAGPGNHRVEVIDIATAEARELADRLSRRSARSAVGSDGV